MTGALFPVTLVDRADGNGWSRYPGCQPPGHKNCSHVQNIHAQKLILSSLYTCWTSNVCTTWSETIKCYF